jgi:hypothetical protein
VSNIENELPAKQPVHNTITTEALALLLDKLSEVFVDNTDDWVTIYGLDLASAVVSVDEIISEREAAHIVELMAFIAHSMLWRTSSKQLPVALQAQLRTIERMYPDLCDEQEEVRSC